jgi:hypothetical protein
MKLTPIFFAMLPALAVFASQAEVYQVVELGPIEGYKSSFSAGINNNNQTVGTVSNQFNYPVDLSAIDYESSFITGNLSAADIEEVKKGNVNSGTLSVLKGYLQNAGDDYTVQRFVDAFAVRFDSRQQIKLRETNTPQTNYEYLVDINDNGAILGYASAPYTKQPFTPAATETVPNPITRQIWVPEDGYLLGMLVNNGNRYKLQPLYTKFGGGYSVPRAFSNNGYIVGNGSVGLNTGITEEAMTSLCLGDTSPKALCFNAIVAGSAPYRITGLAWQLDNNGVPGPATELGFLGDKKSGLAHTRTDYPPVIYNSSPSDVNDAGIAVGVSVYSDSDNIRYNPYNYRDEVFAVSQATVFHGSEISMITDVNEWESSRAYSINNKNVIVGAARKIWYQGPDRFFVYDLNTQKLTFPTDLFDSATTIPAAINENNQVVGTTESFTEGSSVRRSAAFWYDMNTGVFSDLNKLLPCNSGYTLISAQDINDKNVIVATATKKVDARDSKGEVVKDSAGNPIQEEVAIAVQLLPVANGAVSTCTTPADEGYSRQGGSIGFGWMSLLLLPLLRRRLR